MTATARDITFNTEETASALSYAALSHIEDVARITLADVDEAGLEEDCGDYEAFILSL